MGAESGAISSRKVAPPRLSGGGGVAGRVAGGAYIRVSLMTITTFKNLHQRQQAAHLARPDPIDTLPIIQVEQLPLSGCNLVSGSFSYHR